jgi:hypothetical protein
MFSFLDEIEEKIEALRLRVVFEDGSEAVLANMQIYPSTNSVSFQALKRIVSRSSGTFASTRMEIGFSPVQALVERPGESLSVEFKRWINPDQPEGIAIIVRAALALRNHGDGYLVIGFDNKTLQPDRNNVLSDVEAVFHEVDLQICIGTI